MSFRPLCVIELVVFIHLPEDKAANIKDASTELDPRTFLRGTRSRSVRTDPIYQLIKLREAALACIHTPPIILDIIAFILSSAESKLHPAIFLFFFFFAAATLAAALSGLAFSSSSRSLFFSSLYFFFSSRMRCSSSISAGVFYRWLLKKVLTTVDIRTGSQRRQPERLSVPAGNGLSPLYMALSLVD